MVRRLGVASGYSKYQGLPCLKHLQTPKWQSSRYRSRKGSCRDIYFSWRRIQKKWIKNRIIGCEALKQHTKIIHGMWSFFCTSLWQNNKLNWTGLSFPILFIAVITQRKLYINIARSRRWSVPTISTETVGPMYLVVSFFFFGHEQFEMTLIKIYQKRQPLSLRTFDLPECNLDCKTVRIFAYTLFFL